MVVVETVAGMATGPKGDKEEELLCSVVNKLPRRSAGAGHGAGGPAEAAPKGGGGSTRPKWPWGIGSRESRGDDAYEA